MGNKQSSPIQQLSKTASEIGNSSFMQDSSRTIVNTVHGMFHNNAVSAIKNNNVVSSTVLKPVQKVSSTISNTVSNTVLKPVQNYVVSHVASGYSYDHTKDIYTYYPDWMGNLTTLFPSSNLKLSQMVIPGTHDSASTNSGLSWTPLRPWALTQLNEIEQQLELGARVLDLRFGDKNGRLSFVHGSVVIGGLTPERWLNEQMKNIRSWLNDHQNEIIIMKCKISTAGKYLDDSSLKKLANIIYANFRGLLIEKTNRDKDIRYLQNINQRVYCTWDVKKLGLLDPNIQKYFQGNLFTSWAGGNVMTESQLKTWLEQNFDQEKKVFKDWYSKDQNNIDVARWSMNIALPAAGTIDGNIPSDIVKISSMIKAKIPLLSNFIDTNFQTYLRYCNMIGVDYIGKTKIVEYCIKTNIEKLCDCNNVDTYFKHIHAYTHVNK